MIQELCVCDNYYMRQQYVARKTREIAVFLSCLIVILCDSASVPSDKVQAWRLKLSKPTTKFNE